MTLSRVNEFDTEEVVSPANLRSGHPGTYSFRCLQLVDRLVEDVKGTINAKNAKQICRFDSGWEGKV